MIRILVVADHPIVREGLVAVLENQPDFQVAGAAALLLQANPRLTPSTARGSLMKRGLWMTLMVCCAASPGTTSLRPPENPAIR